METKRRVSSIGKFIVNFDFDIERLEVSLILSENEEYFYALTTDTRYEYVEMKKKDSNIIISHPNVLGLEWGDRNE